MKNLNNNKLFLIPLIVLVLPVMFGSCKKINDELPAVKSISTDDTAQYYVGFELNKQIVAVSTSNDTLKMVLKEDVALLLSQINYIQSWSIHLFEDFSKSQLKNFNYTTVNDGDTTFNWVNDNLNDVKTKIISDTTINNKKMVKIEIKRDFSFTSVYPNVEEAVKEQNLLLHTTTDQVVYSSDVLCVQTFPLYYGTGSIVYVNGND